MRYGQSSAVVLITALFVASTTTEASRGRVVGTIAGTGSDENNGNQGRATEVNLGQPFGVELRTDRTLFITEVKHHRVWRLDRTSNQMTRVAGNGRAGYSGDGGPATEASLNEPYEVRFDAAGNLFVVEMKNHLVRRIDAKTGRISTVAGTGEPGFSGDGGPSHRAMLRFPHGIVFDGAGRLYIADIGNHRIRRVDPVRGTIETIAGTGETTSPREGIPAAESSLPGPRALAAHQDSLWVVLREGHSLWRIDLMTGRLHHVAGTGQPGFSGDGGPARMATFNGPKGLAVDSAKNLYVVDSENDAVRLIDATTGLVTTIAGTGRSLRFEGDGGPAESACFAQPHGICVDSDGSVIIGDTLNHRVRRISAPSR